MVPHTVSLVDVVETELKQCCDNYISVLQALVQTNNVSGPFSVIIEPPRGKTNNVVSERSDTNRPVQAQKRARSLKFRI